MASPAAEVLELRLPPLSEDDPLFHAKKRMLENLSLSVQLPIPSSADAVTVFLDQLVRAARILHMNEVELYFAEEDDVGPFSPRNELESLNTILNVINAHLTLAVSSNSKDTLNMLYRSTLAMIESVGLDHSDDLMIQTQRPNSDDEDILMKWGKTHGVRTMLQITSFEGAGRGFIASEDLGVGDTTLEIPESLIISEDLVCETDMYPVLRNLDGISMETMILLWSMRERFNSASKFTSYFEALPEKFNTGLSFSFDGLAALEGTLLFEELMQSKEHLHQQYEKLFPMLCTSYPNVFKPELFTWEKFLWACELWYSNSMRIVMSDGGLKTCLVPIAGFFNHSTM